MPDVELSLERKFTRVNGNALMHEHIRALSAAIDELRAERHQLERANVELFARLHRVETDLAAVRAKEKA